MTDMDSNKTYTMKRRWAIDPVFQWSEWWHWRDGEYNWLNLDLFHLGIEYEPYVRPGDWEVSFWLIGVGFVLKTWRDEPPGPMLKRAMELRDEFLKDHGPISPRCPACGVDLGFTTDKYCHKCGYDLYPVMDHPMEDDQHES